MLNATTERRRFFRINDTVSLSYQPIDEATANAGLKSDRPINGQCSLSATLDVLSQEALAVMKHLEKQNPDFLQLYRILDAKINAIAQSVMFVGSNVNAHNSQDINLSASGLAFQQSEALPVGQNLSIDMYLPTTLSLIYTYGRVINCVAVDADANCPAHHLISVEFTHIREEDQELLIKHVVRMQWQQLRQTKAETTAT
ncbi:MAG: pilus assembly protein PilZ [Methylomonas sp.]|nr:MAG: pilus assembly protein PilZ [Methylomonas sp.]